MRNPTPTVGGQFHKTKGETMAERTPKQQAQFDAAELINQSNNPPIDVVLEIQNVKVGTKSTIKE